MGGRVALAPKRVKWPSVNTRASESLLRTPMLDFPLLLHNDPESRSHKIKTFFTCFYKRRLYHLRTIHFTLHEQSPSYIVRRAFLSFHCTQIVHQLKCEANRQFTSVPNKYICNIGNASL